MANTELGTNQQEAIEMPSEPQERKAPPLPPPMPKSNSDFLKPKAKGLTSALSSPNLTPGSKAILQKMAKDNPAPFQVSIEKYSQAIAESILVQSEAMAAGRINFEDEMRRVVEFKGGSYGLIYKGNTPLRVAPFNWQLDQGTRRIWAVFTFNNFYGHTLPPWFKNPVARFRQNVSIIMVLTPFDNSSGMVDDYGKGYLVKFDERTQFQMPLNIQDTKEAEKVRIDNKHFISAALTLWMDLQAYTKPKLNMKFIMYLAIGAGIVVFMFWFLKSHPGFLSSVFGPNL